MLLKVENCVWERKGLLRFCGIWNLRCEDRGSSSRRVLGISLEEVLEEKRKGNDREGRGESIIIIRGFLMGGEVRIIEIERGI